MKIVTSHFAVFLFFSIAVSAQTAKKYFSTAEKFQETQNYTDAVINYTKALELDPEYGKAYEARGFCYEKIGKKEDAATDYKRATVFSPKNKLLYYNAGRLFYDIQKFNEAEAMLKVAVERDGDYNEAIELRLKTLLQIKNYNDGLLLAKKWIDNKKTGIAFFYHAVLLDSLKNYVEAEKEYKNAKYYDSKLIPAYTGLILVLNKINKNDEALNIAEAGLQKEPSSINILHARSIVYGSKGDYLNAINDLSKVIINNQSRMDLFLLRATYYEKLGQYQNAIYDYSKVLTIDTKNIDAYYSRANNYEQLANYKAAIADYEKVATLMPMSDKAKLLMAESEKKLFELNRETYKPEINLTTPKANERNLIKVPIDKTELLVKGFIKDASKIKSIIIDETTAQFAKDTLNPFFSAKIQLASTANEIKIIATDVYDNSQKLILVIERTEIDAPTVSLTAPLASSDNEIMLETIAPELYLEGKILDASLIESIVVEGVSASFQIDALNPVFSTKINISNKNSLNIKVRDINGNESNLKYSINRTGAMEAKDNPMGLTWVVFIENSNYKNFSILEGPAKDVSIMKSALANYRINKIIHKKDFSKTEIDNFFSIELRDQLRNNNVKSLVIWYSGHGKFINQTGYWIPVDAKRDDEKSYYNVTNIQVALKGYTTLEHKLVVTDACESGPSFLFAMKGDEEKKCYNDETGASKTAQALTAAGFELAADKSVFSSAFSKALQSNKESCVSIDKIFTDYIDKAVQSATKQKPKFGKIELLEHNDKGTFFFIKK